MDELLDILDRLASGGILDAPWRRLASRRTGFLYARLPRLLHQGVGEPEQAALARALEVLRQPPLVAVLAELETAPESPELADHGRLPRNLRALLATAELAAILRQRGCAAGDRGRVLDLLSTAGLCDLPPEGWLQTIQPPDHADPIADLCRQLHAAGSEPAAVELYLRWWDADEGEWGPAFDLALVCCREGHGPAQLRFQARTLSSRAGQLVEHPSSALVRLDRGWEDAVRSYGPAGSPSYSWWLVPAEDGGVDGLLRSEAVVGALAAGLRLLAQGEAPDPRALVVADVTGDGRVALVPDTATLLAALPLASLRILGPELPAGAPAGYEVCTSLDALVATLRSSAQSERTSCRAIWERVSGFRLLEQLGGPSAIGAGYAAVIRSGGEQPNGYLPATRWVDELPGVDRAVVTALPGADQLLVVWETVWAVLDRTQGGREVPLPLDARDALVLGLDGAFEAARAAVRPCVRESAAVERSLRWLLVLTGLEELGPDEQARVWQGIRDAGLDCRMVVVVDPAGCPTDLPGDWAVYSLSVPGPESPERGHLPTCPLLVGLLERTPYPSGSESSSGVLSVGELFSRLLGGPRAAPAAVAEELARARAALLRHPGVLETGRIDETAYAEVFGDLPAWGTLLVLRDRKGGGRLLSPELIAVVVGAEDAGELSNLALGLLDRMLELDRCQAEGWLARLSRALLRRVEEAGAFLVRLRERCEAAGAWSLAGEVLSLLAPRLTDDDNPVAFHVADRVLWHWLTTGDPRALAGLDHRWGRILLRRLRGRPAAGDPTPAGEPAIPLGGGRPPTPEERARLVRALACCGDEGLVEDLFDEDEEVRRTAALGLGRVPWEAAVGRLGEIAHGLGLRRPPAVTSLQPLLFGTRVLRLRDLLGRGLHHRDVRVRLAAWLATRRLLAAGIPVLNCAERFPLDGRPFGLDEQGRMELAWLVEERNLLCEDREAAVEMVAGLLGDASPLVRAWTARVVHESRTGRYDDPAEVVQARHRLREMSEAALQLPGHIWARDPGGSVTRLAEEQAALWAEAEHHARTTSVPDNLGPLQHPSALYRYAFVAAVLHSAYWVVSSDALGHQMDGQTALAGANAGQWAQAFNWVRSQSSDSNQAVRLLAEGVGQGIPDFLTDRWLYPVDFDSIDELPVPLHRRDRFAEAHREWRVALEAPTCGVPGNEQEAEEAVAMADLRCRFVPLRVLVEHHVRPLVRLGLQGHPTDLDWARLVVLHYLASRNAAAIRTAICEEDPCGHFIDGLPTRARFALTYHRPLGEPRPEYQGIEALRRRCGEWLRSDDPHLGVGAVDLLFRLLRMQNLSPQDHGPGSSFVMIMFYGSPEQRRKALGPLC